MKYNDNYDSSSNEGSGLFKQTEILCELWNEEQIEMKPHSRLYHLEPIGIGMPMVESLTSYITRLAEAHCTYPRTLITDEISPHLTRFALHQDGEFIYRNLTSFWRRSCTINGITSSTADMVNALEQLTLHHNLRFLTMLSWQNALSPRKLLKRTRSWCLACLEEWKETDQVIYEPLLWTLDAVTGCHRHRLHLQMCCPYSDCGKVQPPLAPHGQPGYCSACNRWQGSYLRNKTKNLSMLSDEEWEWQQWVAKTIGDLLSAAPQLSALPSQGCMSTIISKYANILTNGNKTALLQQVYGHWESGWSWLYGNHIPQLGSLLQICFHLGTSLSDLLTGEIPEKIATQQRPPEKNPSNLPLKRPYRLFDPISMRQQLEVILQNSKDTPISLKEAAQHLGYSTNQLRRYFPDLCRAISAQYKTSFTFATQQQMLEEGLNTFSKRGYRRIDPVSTQQALETVLQDPESASLSVNEIARRLEYDQSRLRKHFPELCQKISTRYRAYQIARREERLQRILDEVKEIMLTIHKQGRFPSRRQIRKFLQSPRVLQIPEVIEMWRKTLKDLGWGP